MHELITVTLFRGLPEAKDHLWPAFVVTAAFTVAARSVRGVSISGSIAGAIVCFILYAAAGPGAVLALVCVFILTWLATRFGYKRKQSLGTAENQAGRTAAQVFANLATAAGFAAFSALTNKHSCLVAAVAALSEAAADTVSSELGQVGRDTARLITTWQSVPAGTNGGVTLTGTSTGAAAAGIVGAVSIYLGLVSLRAGLICWFAGSCGMIADSYLGATLERRRVLGNNGVNFISTLIAAVIGLLMAP